MISNTSRRQPDRPLAPTYLLMIALFLTVPILAVSHWEQRSREEAAAEYAADRDGVLNAIGQAAAAQDLSTLRKIQKRFSAAVKEREFTVLLERATAEVIAKDAEMEFNTAKHLDLARHREESSMRLVQAYPSVELDAGERLSVLPH